MSTSLPLFPEFSSSKPQHDQEEEEEIEYDEALYQSYTRYVSTLPENRTCTNLRRYQGFWMKESWIPATLAARDHFVARPDDVFLASVPKSGTTWLKSLVFSVVHRGRHPPRDGRHPLRAANPHDLVHLLDDLYLWQRTNPDLITGAPSPRIFATHTPYSLLPESVKASGCRVIFVAREPKDTFVSYWHFFRAMLPPNSTKRHVSMDDAFHLFCTGVSLSGPIWDHMLEYWNEHVRRPHDVLFLKFEAMKEDPLGSLKKLASFLGCPFSADEEKRGVPEDISDLCSFKSLSNLGVNKEGVLHGRSIPLEAKMYFRRGEVGDWSNHLTPEMAEKVDKITQEKLQGSGLSF